MTITTNFIARILNDLCWSKGITVATAESCTAGNIAASIAAIPGSSHIFCGGIVAYTNKVKTQVLGVNKTTIDEQGVVSEQTVIEMAKGAMKVMNTDCAVATSGIAGPGGGTAELPVGTIWIAACYRDKTLTLKLSGDQGRGKNVENATFQALKLLIDVCKS